MIEPIFCIIHPKARYQDFIRYNFVDHDHILYKKCWLYKKMIYLELEIDLKTRIISIQVKKRNGELYTPFYHSNERVNNSLYEEVIIKYNRIITNYINCELFS